MHSALETQHIHQDTRKYWEISKRQRNRYIVIALIVSMIILPSTSFFYYKFAVKRPNQSNREVTLEIKGGESVSAIATKLYNEDVINSEFLFKTYVRINNLQGNIQAGVYTIPAGVNIAEVTQQLQTGRNDIRITFLEGWRAEEFAAHASQTYEKIDYSDFLSIAKSQEGSLFPDTYMFNSDVSEEELLQKLTTNFEEKTKDILTEENLGKENLNLQQILIFASIVEREVVLEEDKKIVAGILVKRWQNDELIGADATTQYVVAPLRYGCDLSSEEICPNAEEIPDINWWPDDLTINELSIQSPYNTRAVVGLPPGPISNPSLSSINAVLNRIETEYYYYLNDSEGTTHFAKTLAEHNANVQKYLR